MKNWLIGCVAAFCLAACTSHNSENTQLQSENKRLTEAAGVKNNEILALRKGLSMIDQRIHSLINDEELWGILHVEKSGSGLEQMLEEIDQIQLSIRTNRIELFNLNESESRLKGEHGVLRDQIQWLDQQLSDRNGQLEGIFRLVEDLRGQLYEANIANENLEKSSVELLENMNKIYLVLGDKDVLMREGIAHEKRGFLGFRKWVSLDPDMDTRYFMTGDKRSITELPVNSTKASLLSAHPLGSYHWAGAGSQLKLVISDPDAFWGHSKYLAVLTE